MALTAFRQRPHPKRHPAATEPAPPHTPAGRHPTANRGVSMPDMDTALKEIMEIDGAIGVALVDHTSGMALGTVGGGKELDLTVAAAGNTDVVRAKLRAMEMLNITEKIEDILITLDTQYHMIRPLTSRSGKGLFLYLALRRDRANLAMARHQLKRIEADLDV
jgi:hypothetical protein